MICKHSHLNNSTHVILQRKEVWVRKRDGTWRLLEPGWSREMPSNVRSCFTVRAGGLGW